MSKSMNFRNSNIKTFKNFINTIPMDLKSSIKFKLALLFQNNQEKMDHSIMENLQFESRILGFIVSAIMCIRKIPSEGG